MTEDERNTNREFVYDTDELLFHFHRNLKRMHRAYLAILNDKYGDEFIREVAGYIRLLREDQKSIVSIENDHNQILLDERDDTLLTHENALTNLYRQLGKESDLKKILYPDSN